MEVFDVFAQVAVIAAIIFAIMKLDRRDESE